MTLTEHQLTTADGRTIGFTRQGSATGFPVFYLHGIPGSRHEPRLPDMLAGHIHVVAPDRPGVGGSDPLPDYSLADHAGDLLAIADHLEISRFALFGFSGGGVYALAVAPLLRDRLERMVISGTPALTLLDDPFSQAGELTAGTWRQARDNPDALARELQALTAHPETLEQALLDSLAPPDRKLFRQPDLHAHYQQNLRTALARGAETAAHTMARDTTLLVNGLGVKPEAIRVPVHVHHGTEDSLVSHHHAIALARALPHGNLILEPGAGHFAAVYGTPAEALWRHTAGTGTVD